MVDRVRCNHCVFAKTLRQWLIGLSFQTWCHSLCFFQIGAARAALWPVEATDKLFAAAFLQAAVRMQLVFGVQEPQ